MVIIACCQRIGHQPLTAKRLMSSRFHPLCQPRNDRVSNMIREGMKDRRRSSAGNIGLNTSLNGTAALQSLLQVGCDRNRLPRSNDWALRTSNRPAPRYATPTFAYLLPSPNAIDTDVGTTIAAPLARELRASSSRTPSTCSLARRQRCLCSPRPSSAPSLRQLSASSSYTSIIP